MPRVTAAEVKLILDTDLDIDVINAFILGAYHSVNEVIGNDTTISDDLKKEIERWLSAHFIASTREQQISKAGAGGASVTYQGTTGRGLDSTMYGQQVLVLDTTGKFRNLTVNKTASITAVSSFT